MPEPVIEWIPGMWALTGKLLRLSLQSGDYKKTALGTGETLLFVELTVPLSKWPSKFYYNRSQQIRGSIVFGGLKIIKLTFAICFYCHNVPVILNNVSDKTFLPEKIFCWCKF